MKVPNGEKAVVDIGKLRNYCLDPNHEVGKHKARVFASVLGMDMRDAGVLQNALLEAVKTNESTIGSVNEFGQRYIVDFDVAYGERSARIRSVWIVDTESAKPRLITCFVL